MGDGDNRSHSSDSRGHCVNNPADLDPQNPAGNVYCTGEQDPILATVPVDNVIGKTRFIAWPPGRWGRCPR